MDNGYGWGKAKEAAGGRRVCVTRTLPHHGRSPGPQPRHHPLLVLLLLRVLLAFHRALRPAPAAAAPAATSSAAAEAPAATPATALRRRRVRMLQVPTWKVPTWKVNPSCAVQKKSAPFHDATLFASQSVE